MMNKKIIVMLVICITLLVGGIVGCSGKNDSSVGSEITRVVSHADRPKYTNMKDLSQASDLIFVGTVEGIEGTHNLARNPEDPKQEDPNFYLEGVDYNVKVNEVLKGHADPYVIVIEEKQMREQDQQMVPVEHYIGLAPGQSYVFFVNKDPEGRYFGVGDPFFFAIQNNKAILKTKEKELLDIYKPKDINLFKKEVKEEVEENK